VAIVLGLAHNARAAALPVPQEGQFVEGMVSLRFAPGVTEADRQAIFDDLGARSVRHLDWIDWWSLEISRRTTAEAMSRWSESPLVEWIEPNGIVHGYGEIPSDPEFGKQWHLRNIGQPTLNSGPGTPGADIDAVRAWCISKGDPSVVVAVLDTGVRLDHPDLAPSIFTNVGEIPGNGIDDDGNGLVDDVHGWNFEDVETTPGNSDASDTHGHGTLVAGIIAGLDNGEGAVGVAPGTTILPVRVLTQTQTFPPSGSHVQVALGIRYAVDMGADVLNCSFGGQFGSGLLKSALEYAELHAVEAVCAAGNNQQDIDLFTFFPAGYKLSNIISVAASDPDDELALSFTNWGHENVDLVAPGVDIRGPIHRRDDPHELYGGASGTSFAAPMVTGALALLEAFVPGLDYPTPRDVVLTGIDEKPRLFGFVNTGGRLNVHRLLRTVSPIDTIPPARVQDLGIAEVGRNWVELEWTASGDDGIAGTACCYDIRYALFEIGDNFQFATIVPVPPAPAPGGERQRFRVEGLDPGTVHHFALNVADEAFGIALPSNEVSAATLPVAFNLDRSEVDLAGRTGETGVITLDFQNLTGKTIDYHVTTEREWLVPESPDGFVEGGLTVPLRIHWNATRMWPGLHTGTIRIAADDGTQVALVPVDLSINPAAEMIVEVESLDLGEGFPSVPARRSFLVSNVGYQTLRIEDVILVGEDAADFTVTPTTAEVPPGDSLSLEVRFEPDVLGPRSATLTLLSDDPFGGAVTIPLTGLGVVPPVMEFQRDSISVVGFAGTITDPVPLTVRNANADGGHLDVRFRIRQLVTGGASREVGGLRDGEVLANPWLAVEPATLRVAPGESLGAQVFLRSEQLGPGRYVGQVVLLTNDPARREVVVPVDFDVHGVADLSLESGTVDFGNVPAGTFVERTLLIANPGTEILDVHPAVSGRFRLMGSDLTVPPGESSEVRVRYLPTGGGEHATLLHLETNDPDRPLATVPLVGRASENAAWSGTVRIDGVYVVEPGRTVRVGPGTRIVLQGASDPARAAEPPGLVVRGDLLLEGSADDPVRIESGDGEPWGLVVEGSATMSHAELTGAGTALRVTGAGAVQLDCSRLSGNDVGIEYVGGGGASLNLRGVRLENRHRNLVVGEAAGLSAGSIEGAGNVFVLPAEDGGVNVERTQVSAAPLSLVGNAWLSVGGALLRADDADVLRASVIGPGADDVVLLPVLERLPEDCEDLVAPPPPPDPIAFSFARAMRNPARSALTVDYALPAGFQGRVRLDVYDVRGARVALLLDEPGRPGRYDVLWRLQDDAGQRVSTGVYFLRLDAGPFGETRKVVVLR
jgi:hypothetical protein